MTHVTDSVKRVVDTQLTAGLRRVRNDGPDPIDISIDPEVAFGEGTRIASGAAAQLSVPTGRSLYAVCGEGGEADVALVDPVEDSNSSAEVFEVTDLLIPAGTDWSEATGHVLGSVVVPEYGGLLFALDVEVSADPSVTVGIAVTNESWGQAAGVGALAPDLRGSVTGFESPLGPFFALNDTSIEARTFNVVITTGGAATDADTVVHARAVFLSV